MIPDSANNFAAWAHEKCVLIFDHLVARRVWLVLDLRGRLRGVLDPGSGL